MPSFRVPQDYATYEQALQAYTEGDVLYLENDVGGAATYADDLIGIRGRTDDPVASPVRIYTTASQSSALISPPEGASVADVYYVEGLELKADLDKACAVLGPTHGATVVFNRCNFAPESDSSFDVSGWPSATLLADAVKIIFLNCSFARPVDGTYTMLTDFLAPGSTIEFQACYIPAASITVSNCIAGLVTVSDFVSTPTAGYGHEAGSWHYPSEPAARDCALPLAPRATWQIPGDFATISAAQNSVLVQDGDTLILQPGTHQCPAEGLLKVLNMRNADTDPNTWCTLEGGRWENGIDEVEHVNNRWTTNLYIKWTSVPDVHEIHLEGLRFDYPHNAFVHPHVAPIMRQDAPMPALFTVNFNRCIFVSDGTDRPWTRGFRGAVVHMNWTNCYCPSGYIGSEFSQWFTVSGSTLDLFKTALQTGPLDWESGSGMPVVGVNDWAAGGTPDYGQAYGVYKLCEDCPKADLTATLDLSTGTYAVILEDMPNEVALTASNDAATTNAANIAIPYNIGIYDSVKLVFNRTHYGAWASDDFSNAELSISIVPGAVPGDITLSADFARPEGEGVVIKLREAPGVDTVVEVMPGAVSSIGVTQGPPGVAPIDLTTQFTVALFADTNKNLGLEVYENDTLLATAVTQIPFYNTQLSTGTIVLHHHNQSSDSYEAFQCFAMVGAEAPKNYYMAFMGTVRANDTPVAARISIFWEDDRELIIETTSSAVDGYYEVIDYDRDIFGITPAPCMVSCQYPIDDEVQPLMHGPLLPALFSPDE